jgi:hypothetical protein
MKMREVHRLTSWAAAAISAATCVTSVGSDAPSHASHWRSSVNGSATRAYAKPEKPALAALGDGTSGSSEGVALSGRFE